MAARMEGSSCLLSLLTVLNITLLLTSVEGKLCLDHFSVEGIEKDGIAEKNNTITVNYFLNKDTKLIKESLYTIHWDEPITHVVTKLDQRFSVYFKIKNWANNEWRIFLQRPLRSNVFAKQGAEFSSTFGPFKDLLNCTVTLRHFIKDEDSEDKSYKTSISYIDKKIRKEQDVFESTQNSAFQDDPDENSTTSEECQTSESLTEGNRDAWVNYRITVGVLGGFLGLALLVGISVGLYHNYKRSSRLGLFRHRQPKTISLLGQAYPNIAMSNTDMRLNSRDAYEPSSTSYPAYGFANPAATEDAPPAYTPEII